MHPFQDTRSDSSPYSPNRSGASTPLYFSDTDFNLPLKAAEMTESSIHVKYSFDEDLLNARHLKMSGARKRKMKWLLTRGYSRKEAFEKSLEHLQKDRCLSDKDLPSPDIKRDHNIPPSARTDLLDPDDQLIIKKYKMGGARRKRYKWFLKHGYSQQEAALKSLHPMHTDINQTENRFHDNLHEVERKKKSSSDFFPTRGNKGAAKSSSSPKYFEEKEICVQIGIFPAAFPEAKFQKEQFEALQDCLSEHILKDTVSMPQFLGTICKNGWLQITCANMIAVKWVINIIPFLKPWKDAKLYVLEEKDFPKPMNLICFLPKSSAISNECILHYLQKQNPKNLEISSWKILHREDSSDVTKVIISIDDISALLLTKNGAKLYYMLASVKFMVVSTQLHGPENGTNLINDTEKSMKQPRIESIARPSRYTPERSSFPSKINSTSNYESILVKKNIGPTIKLNEYNIPDEKDRFERNSNHFTSHHNRDGYPSTSSFRKVEQEIYLLEEQLRSDRRALEVERKRVHSYTQRRSRSPRRYDDDRNRYRDRDRDRGEGNRRGSNSLVSFPQIDY